MILQAAMLFLLLLLFVSSVAALDSRSTFAMMIRKQKALLELQDYVKIDSPVVPWTAPEPQFSVHNILSAISQEQAIVGLSPECQEDLDLIAKATAAPALYPAFIRSVLIPMHDSSGKKGPALLKGHLYFAVLPELELLPGKSGEKKKPRPVNISNLFAGHYSECASIDYAVDGRERSFRGGYFRIALDLFLRPNSQNGSCTGELDFMQGVDLFWELGVCLPASCSSADLLSIFRPVNGSLVDNPVCSIMKSGELVPDWDAGFYVTISLMGTVAAVCIVAGVVDYFFGEQLEQSTISKSLPYRLFISCSLYTNIAGIFEVDSRSQQGQISCFPCIRFFSMVWVVVLHMYPDNMVFAVNPVDVMSIATDITSEVVTNGYFSVDSFFFMGGVLVTFTWFKSYQRSPKETMSARSWILYYVHRVLRLSPTFYFLVLFYTFVLKQLMRDSPFSMNPMVTGDLCRRASLQLSNDSTSKKSWWMEMLYLHNFVMTDKPCLPHSWYLAADTQMYLFTPLLLVPLAIKPILGFLVAAVFFIISTAVNIFLIFHYHWPTSEGFFVPADPEESNKENYDMLMYNSPLIRCQASIWSDFFLVFIMGMLVGWFLRTRKTLRVHWLLNLICWAVAFALMLTVVLGLHNQTNGEEISVFWRAMYSALSRPAWALGLTAITVLCFYGYGGPINAFMSWHIWMPLGRLSYTGYLIHIPILQLILAQSKDEVYFSNFIEFFTTRVISVVVVTFFFATFWSACFEISFGRMEKLLLNNVRTPIRIKVKGDTKKNAENVEATLRL